ncbi:hypothetical protein Bbelb_177140 [Branchiostoma belcheri]|nr:hypothetical protein Bbelb_177140 [Branchiostoma belcheri]
MAVVLENGPGFREAISEREENGISVGSKPLGCETGVWGVRGTCGHLSLAGEKHGGLKAQECVTLSGGPGESTVPSFSSRHPNMVHQTDPMCVKELFWVPKCN